ncbi:MAG: TonB-dependent receptor domain-containing protein [Sphingomonas sp.]
MAARTQQVRFDIPAQDLARALQVLARQAGTQILFPYALTTGKRSKPLHAKLPVDAALRRLIAGQGLEAVYLASDQITLGPARLPIRTATARVVPQQRPAPQRPPTPRPPVAIEGPDIIVTGRVVSTRMATTAYSYAATTIDFAGASSRSAPRVADLFRLVPGFWVESSGGEGSNNVRSRGIPTDGFTSIALTENGLPIQYDGGLGYLNTDQSFRLDDTIARVDVARGGPSVLFAPNAPGGVANMVTRTGLTNPGGSIKASLGDHGFARFDAVYAARVAPDLGVMVGGFYRRDGGRRRPGYVADAGGQVRIGLNYDDGANQVSLDLRHLDDRVTFYLPVPLRLDGDRRVTPIPGFDPLRYSLSGPETLHLPIRTARGPFDFDLTQGTKSLVTALNLRGHFRLGNGLDLVSGASWRTSDILRNALFPVGNPVPLGDFLTSVRAATFAAFPQGTQLAARYATNGAPVPVNANGNGLVLGANLLSVHVPLDELIADNRLTWQFDQAGHHAIGLGMTMAHYSYRFDRVMGTVLLDVRNQARLIDIVALNAQGAAVGNYTDHGFQRYGSIFDSAAIGVDALAFYAGDEWQVGPRLRIDLGGRWERNRIHGQTAGKALFDLGNPETLADDNVLGQSGTIIGIDRAFSAFGWSIGASYNLAPQFGLFARYTHSFRLPSASEFNGNPSRTDEAVVPIRLAEAGLKYSRPNLNVFATGFYTQFDRLPFTDFRFDSASNAYVERTAIAGSQTLGVELEAHAQPVEWFELDVQATWQLPRYRNFAFTDLVSGVPVQRDYSGRQLIRVPRLSLRVVPSVNLADHRVRLQIDMSAFSERFSDIANTQRLPGYALLGGSVTFSPAKGATLTLEGKNLTNTLGLTEGNPRSGSFETGSSIQSYFFARPEFARSFRIVAALKF